MAGERIYPVLPCADLTEALGFYTALGDEAQAIKVLDAGLIRYPDAPPLEVFEALLYRAELLVRTGADPAPDLSAAGKLLAEHQLGSEAEQLLATATAPLTP